MKNFGKVMGAVLTLFLLAVLGGYFFLFRDGQIFVQRHKSDLVGQANAFMACMMIGDVPKCSPRFLSEKFQKNTPTDQLVLMSAKLRKALGERVNSVTRGDSFKWTEYRGSGGPTLSIRFDMTASYVREGNVTEDYTIVRHGDGPLLIEAFRVDADQNLTSSAR